MMWKRKKDKSISIKEENLYNEPSHVDLETVKKAVREFADKAPKGITTRVLVKDDQSIDFDLLKPYLKGIPDKRFYMSKETYEIFEEEDKKIPFYLDMIQNAVDRYIEMYHKVPITPGDPYLKVNYLLLKKNNLIHEIPEIELFITEDENLITHKRPN